MNDVAPDLTPPTKSAKAPKVPKEPKTPKVKAEKVAKDPSAPKKERGPRVDYGYSPDSVIHIVKEKDAKHRGQRKAWFDSLVAYDGQSVQAWEASRATAGEKDPPRGWLRHFVQEGFVTLNKPVLAS